ncbi:hypothetical protein M6B38_340010 [Iris pallida]|uniref:Uncharacterized protein n=1 Tax=Iris pallida TaxID=29817 RepID=A0AAX6GY39_IRIPA|nr:hypothetical protein M6B38_340010 [Iris pallida]
MQPIPKFLLLCPTQEHVHQNPNSNPKPSRLMPCPGHPCRCHLAQPRPTTPTADTEHQIRHVLLCATSTITLTSVDSSSGSPLPLPCRNSQPSWTTPSAGHACRPHLSTLYRASPDLTACSTARPGAHVCLQPPCRRARSRHCLTPRMSTSTPLDWICSGDFLLDPFTPLHWRHSQATRSAFLIRRRQV